MERVIYPTTGSDMDIFQTRCDGVMLRKISYTRKYTMPEVKEEQQMYLDKAA